MWLTEALDTILREMIAADARGDYSAAEIVCDGGQCYVGNRRIHKGSVNRLLRLMAISDASDTNEIKRYTINEMGRAIHARPAIIQELVAALTAGYKFTVRDNKIVPLDDPTLSPQGEADKP